MPTAKAKAKLQEVKSDKTTKYTPTKISYKQITDLRSIFCHSLKMIIMYGDSKMLTNQNIEYDKFVDSAYSLSETAKLFGIKLTSTEIGPYLQSGFKGIGEDKPSPFKPKDQLVHDVARLTPLVALNEVFDRTSAYCLTVDITEWLTSALTNDEGSYSLADSRFYLIWFYEWLQVICFAMYCVYIETTLGAGEPNPHLDKLTYDYITYCNNKNSQPITPREPSGIVRALCSEFDASHARAELWDWLEAGLSNNRFYTKKADVSNLFHSYQSILAVIESAYAYTQSYYPGPELK
ncbi:MAG: hypothetical protein J7497_06665 [Chitinophagaceae bacterium]|nr:hypothetical protein [Chitinophagaceae bacterium]